MEAQTAQEVINALGAISKARFIAMDEDGQWWAYVCKPILKNDYWNLGGKGIGCIDSFFNIQPAENWKESLVEYQPNPEIKIQEYGKKI